MKGKLKCGFEYDVNERALSSYTFVDLLSKAADNPIYYPKVFNVVLGEEQKNRLMKHLEVDGFTSIDAMNDALTEIINTAKELKNSSTSLE